jgi:peptidoglycan-associated lipoprotein
MRLKKIAQVVLISCSILALGACSTAKKHGNSSSMGDGEGGAQTSGIEQGEGFGDEGGGSGQGLSKRTYYFDFNSFEIRQSDMSAIEANADYLVAHPNTKIILEGHTDPRGSREYNVALGEHRANAVLEVLKTRGVNPSQVRVVSYGAEQLAAPGHAEQDFQLDRRAVIVYVQR